MPPSALGTHETGESTDTGAGSTTGPSGPMCAQPEFDWSYDFDCMVDWPTMTMVEGAGAAAGLTPVHRVFFGIHFEACAHPAFELQTIVLADPFEPTARMFAAADCGPEQWPGVYVSTGKLTESDEELAAMLTIDGFAGDWVSAEPADPPRFFGSFTGDLVGSFEAIHSAYEREKDDMRRLLVRTAAYSAQPELKFLGIAAFERREPTEESRAAVDEVADLMRGFGEPIAGTSGIRFR